MKTNFTNFKLLSILMALFIGNAVVAFAQAPDKKAAEIKRYETALNAAKAKLATAEKQQAIADSLVSTGETMITDSKSETKALNAELKSLDKQYATNRKPLEKQLKSKDKEELAQAKADIKALDTQYKADFKATDTKIKANAKKMTTGEANIAKGKASKKTAEAAVKTAQASVDAAQEKYNAAAGIEDEPSDADEDNGVKKKNKKK